MRLYKISLLIGLMLYTSIPSFSQYKTNFGLNQPQDRATLPVSVVKPQTAVRKEKLPVTPNLLKITENEFILNSGWEMAEGDKVTSANQSIFNANFNTSEWFNATVPGTVLTTLVDQGVYPDPYFGLNNLSIPDSLCRKDWWYRLQVKLPENCSEKTIWLLFNGINYKADIWLNGKLLGRIAGAFQRGEFDATNSIKLEGKNILTVHIYPPNNPGIPHEESPRAGQGPNGGQLCLDGPTFISSEGWDWVPGIRDRNIGIWQDVRLRLTDAVIISDPQVITDLPLPDTTSVAITIKSGIRNNSGKAQKVILSGQIENIGFSKTLDLKPGELKQVVFSPTEFNQLNLKNPRLWWPNGYGSPELYRLKLQVKNEDGSLSDQASVRFGIREFSYELAIAETKKMMHRVEFNPVKSVGKVMFNTIDRVDVGKGTFLPKLADPADSSLLTSINKNSDNPFLTIKINGVPVFCRGGNWGMDDGMKRVSRERMEPYFKLHRLANFNMIRNWTGESSEEVFYDLCDEYGMLVWNDFWLSTEGYNLNVNDENLFLANATDVVKRFRNHAAIAVWCPRNEGYAPPQLEPKLQTLIATEDGTRMYQPNSRNLNLRPSGPWHYLTDPAEYFTGIAEGFSTELGTPSVPTAATIRSFMPVEDQWPISDTWYYHDLHDGQKDYLKAIETKYGISDNLDDFCTKAQLVNYDSHRAMFESWNSKMWNKASGLLLWMTHPAWPSTVWQTYSWDGETFGSFFGSKKACEPVHIQLNLPDNKVVVINASMKKYNSLSATMELFDLTGKKLYSKSITSEFSANQLTECFTLELPKYFVDLNMVRLTLQDKKKTIISENEYWMNSSDSKDFQAFNLLPKVKLKVKILNIEKGEETRVDFEVKNTSKTPAIGIKLNLLDVKTNKIILPAYFSDGYFSLFQNETKRFSVIYQGNNPTKIICEGYNGKSN